MEQISEFYAVEPKIFKITKNCTECLHFKKRRLAGYYSKKPMIYSPYWVIALYDEEIA